jgi:hypothetical protein
LGLPAGSRQPISQVSYKSDGWQQARRAFLCLLPQPKFSQFSQAAPFMNAVFISQINSLGLPCGYGSQSLVVYPICKAFLDQEGWGSVFPTQPMIF